MLIIEKDTPKTITKISKEYMESLLLHEWDINVKITDSPGPPNTDALGSTSINSANRFAFIEVSRKILDDPEEVRSTLWHEFLHIVMYPIHDTSQKIIELLEMDQEKRDIYDMWIETSVEEIVRRLEKTTVNS